MLYHVICHLPGGQFRGGHYNKGGATPYPAGAHTAAQLRELAADPHHTVIIGTQLTPALAAPGHILVGNHPVTEAQLAAIVAGDDAARHQAEAADAAAEHPAAPHPAAKTAPKKA